MIDIMMWIITSERILCCYVKIASWVQYILDLLSVIINYYNRYEGCYQNARAGETSREYHQILF